MTSIIKRGFADAAFGQIHYRYAGTGPTIFLCHASPGSAKQLEPLIHQLARTHRVIAADTPGHGDSSPLPVEEPTAADLAEALLAFLGEIGVAHCDVYGSHTGAAIASEMAILDPLRIRKVVLDGMTEFTDAQREEFLAIYADPIPTDLDGAYLLRIFMFCRDQYLFFPWYARDRAHRRDTGLPSADVVADLFLEFLKAHDTYHLAYRAAFAYRAKERAGLITQATLTMACVDDPLCAGTQEATAIMADGRFLCLPSGNDANYADTLASAIAKFCQ